MTSHLHFRLLGELEISDGETPVILRAGKLRVLLATLLLRANQTVTVAELVDRMWGENAPNGARTTTQTYVMRLRRALGDDPRNPDLIHTRPGGYLLTIRPEQLDLLRFRELVRQDSPHEALALWRGEPLVDVPSEALRRDELPRLIEERLQALEQRGDLDLELGRHGELIVELSVLVKEYPLRERFWQQLMLALYRSGRQAEALDRYREIRDLLIEELGVEPGPDLRALHEAILREELGRRRPEPPRAEAVPISFDDRCWWGAPKQGWQRCGWERVRSRWAGQGPMALHHRP